MGMFSNRNLLSKKDLQYFLFLHFYSILLFKEKIINNVNIKYVKLKWIPSKPT